MAYPTTLSNYTGSETLAAATHAQEHNALEAKLGIGASTPASGYALRGTGALASLWLPDNVFNVVQFGAVCDNVTDDTTAVTNAINAVHNAGGGTVLYPGICKITDALPLYSNVKHQGIGMEISGIHQTALNKNGFVGDGLSSVHMQNIGIYGNGSGSTAGTGTGQGVVMTYGSNGNNPYHNFRNVLIRNWGSDGMKIQTAIVSSFDNVTCAYNGGNGFNWYEGGTSCVFADCFARQNAQSGYRLNGSAYINFSGCAADNNGISYEILNAQGIGFFSCGTEGALKNGGSYDGIGWKISNGSNIGLHSCWCFDNRNIGIWVTNTAQVVQIDCADNTPNATAVNFIKVDAGCNASINGLHNTTANSLATGTTVTINDGAGGIKGLDLYALNQTALTTPYFNANKALVSSTIAPILSGDPGFTATATNGNIQVTGVGTGITKTSVLRQDDTTNTAKHNTITLTGWGVMQGASSNLTETVTFGKTFAQRPIVIATWGGDSSSSGAYGSGGNNVKGLAICKAENITTTTFDVRVRTTDGTAWGAGDFVFYQFIAIGELA